MAKNSFFQFKQFVVNQDRCAMKVCTDACVLGAWAKVEAAGRILDIGTGSGLLALMAAQRNATAEVDAVELDSDAFCQAVSNVMSSPFRNRIQVFNQAIQDFNPSYQFDCIITNPPFFQSDMRSPNASKNTAHHAVSLSFDDLLGSFERLLSAGGSCHMLLPVDEASIFSVKARNRGWYLSSKMELYHDHSKKPFRILMTFDRNDLSESQIIEEKMFIYNGKGGNYSDAFKALMKDFYLTF